MQYLAHLVEVSLAGFRRQLGLLGHTELGTDSTREGGQPRRSPVLASTVHGWIESGVGAGDASGQTAGLVSSRGAHAAEGRVGGGLAKSGNADCIRGTEGTGRQQAATTCEQPGMLSRVQEGTQQQGCATGGSKKTQRITAASLVPIFDHQ
jgi:hypothetical protein